MGREDLAGGKKVGADVRLTDAALRNPHNTAYCTDRYTVSQLVRKMSATSCQRRVPAGLATRRSWMRIAWRSVCLRTRKGRRLQRPIQDTIDDVLAFRRLVFLSIWAYSRIFR